MGKLARRLIIFASLAVSVTLTEIGDVPIDHKVSACEGNSGTLYCSYPTKEINPNKTSIKWSWLNGRGNSYLVLIKNSTTVDTGKGYEERVVLLGDDGDASLTINNLKLNDTRVFRCAVSDDSPGGFDVFRHVALTVEKCSTPTANTKEEQTEKDESDKKYPPTNAKEEQTVIGIAGGLIGIAGGLIGFAGGLIGIAGCLIGIAGGLIIWIIKFRKKETTTCTINWAIKGHHAFKLVPHQMVPLIVKAEDDNRFDPFACKVVFPAKEELDARYAHEPTGPEVSAKTPWDMAGMTVGHVPANLCRLFRKLISEGITTNIECYYTGEVRYVGRHRYRRGQGVGGYDLAGGGKELVCSYRFNYRTSKRQDLDRHLRTELPVTEQFRFYL